MTKARQEEWDRVMDSNMRVVCTLCGWVYDGVAREALGAQKLHRTTHGIVPRKRGKKFNVATEPIRRSA